MTRTGRGIFRKRTSSSSKSPPFLVALALVHGTVDLDHYAEAMLHDPQIRGVMKKIEDVPSSELQGHKLIVRLRDGRELTAEVGRNRIVDVDTVLRKFDACAVPVVGKSAAKTIKQQVLALDQLPNIKTLMAACAGS